MQIQEAVVEKSPAAFYLPVGLWPSFVSALFFFAALQARFTRESAATGAAIMADTHELSCHCGTTRWTIAAGAPGTHLKCYCADCQTFARHLGKGDSWLDTAGGTAIFQTTPGNVKFIAGAEHVAVLRLGPKGLFRWYAACCGTPIGNTLSSPGLAFVGAILRPDENRFGPVAARVNTTAAREPVRATGTLRTILGVLSRAAIARLTGGHRRTPFFDTHGTPIAAPKVLTKTERDAARPT